MLSCPVKSNNAIVLISFSPPFHQQTVEGLAQWSNKRLNKVPQLVSLLKCK